MKTKDLAQGAIIAAIYAGLTLLLAPINFGPMQLRVSEALAVLPRLSRAAIPGLFLGCFIGNLVGPYGFVDAVVGSLATLVAALLTYALRKHKWLAPLPPVVINAVVIGFALKYLYGMELVGSGLLLAMVWIGLGQAAACYLIGMPLTAALEKRVKW